MTGGRTGVLSSMALPSAFSPRISSRTSFWENSPDVYKRQSLDDALKLTNKAVMEALDGLPPVKVHCSVLAEQAIKAAISDYYRRKGVDPTPIVGEIPECDHEEGCSCSL